MWTLKKWFLLRSQKKETFYWFSNQNFHIDKYEKYLEKMSWEHKAGNNVHLSLSSLSLNLFLCPSHWYHRKIHHIRGSREHKFCSSCKTYKYILKFKLKYLIPILENFMGTFEGTHKPVICCFCCWFSHFFTHNTLSTWKPVTDYYILYISDT